MKKRTWAPLLLILSGTVLMVAPLLAPGQRGPESEPAKKEPPLGPGRPGGFRPGGSGGPPQPGQVLPAFLQERLNLTAEQREQIGELQKHVDAELARILSEGQN